MGVINISKPILIKKQTKLNSLINYYHHLDKNSQRCYNVFKLRNKHKKEIEFNNYERMRNYEKINI